MRKKTLRDLEVSGKRVLVRVDYNVPMENGSIADDSRIRESLPTLQYLLTHHARVIVCSHFGRPDGKVVQSMRLNPVATRLAELLEHPVQMASDCVGPAVAEKAAGLANGSVLMLENLRFHPEEEKNDPSFARALASLADVFVNDAFGTAHRAHASTQGVTRYLPSVAGLLLEKELEYLGKALENPARPMAALIGGAKASDKLAVLEHLLGKVDYLLIGGGMAATFFKALGYEVGTSLVEPEKVNSVSGLIRLAKESAALLVLPVDVVVAERFDRNAAFQVVAVQQVPSRWAIMDIGPRTIESFETILGRCKTVVWNGPMGVFEFPAFEAGTAAMARSLANLHAITIVGGGSTAEAAVRYGVAHKMSHVSTGGGASLMYLEGKPLPGVEALTNKAEEQPL